MKLGVRGGALAAVLCAVPATAWAHVHVSPESVAAGSYTTLTFKVPTESDTASTTRIEVTLPTDHPFLAVSYAPVPGWKTTVTRSKLPTPVTTDDGTITEAPTKVVWTADSPATALKHGQFQNFPISVGPVPKTSSIDLPTRQTYSDGSVVDWNERAEAGKKEPEKPAPVLHIGAAAPSDAPSASTSGASVAAAPAPKESASKDSSSDSNLGTWLGAGGLALGAAAFSMAAAALARLRRRR